MVNVKLGEAFIEIRATLAKLDQDLAAVNKKVASSLEHTGKKVQEAGKKMSVALTAPTLLLGFGFIRTVGNFERAMNRVAALTGETGSKFQQMRNLAIELGSRTEFSATQAAEGLQFLALAGLTADQAIAALPKTLQLAGVEQIDLATAAEIATNILTQFGLKVQDLGRVNDVLAKTSIISNTGVVLLGESMKFTGTQASLLGIDIEETSAALGLMANRGLTGSLAGTALNNALVQMTAGTETSQKALARLGVEIRDANGNMKPFTEIVRDVDEGLATIGGSAEQAAILTEAFGIRGARAMGILAEAGADDLDKFIADLRAAGGTAEKVRQIQVRGLVKEIDELKSAFEGLAIAIGDAGVLGLFTKLAKRLSEIVREISKTNPEIIRLATVFVGFMAVVGPLLVGLGILIRTLRVLFVTLTLLASPLVIAVGLLGAFALFLKNANQEAKSLSDVWAGMKDDIQSVVDLAKEQVENLTDAIFGDSKGVGGEFGKQLDIAKQKLGELQNAANGAAGGMGAFKDKISAALKQANEDAQFELDLISGKFGDLDEEAVRAARSAGVLKDAIKTIGEGAGSISVAHVDLQKLSETLQEVRKKQDEVAASSQRAGQLGQQLGFTFTSAFEDAVIAGNELSDVLRGLVQDIARVALRMFVTVPIVEKLKAAFEKLMEARASESSSKEGFFLSLLRMGVGLLGGGTTQTAAQAAATPAVSLRPMALGGGMGAGELALVGEKGPELFVPDVSGHIIPNNELVGGGLQVSIFQDIKMAGIEGQMRQVALETMARSKQEIIAAVRTEAQSGSRFRDAFR